MNKISILTILKLLTQAWNFMKSFMDRIRSKLKNLESASLGQTILLGSRNLKRESILISVAVLLMRILLIVKMNRVSKIPSKD
jgi:hypothetical protein